MDAVPDDRAATARAGPAGARAAGPPARGSSSTPVRTRCRRRCWPRRCSGRSTGLPDNPKGWLITAASRRLIELWRKRVGSAPARAGGRRAWGRPNPLPVSGVDDTLTLLLLCCHPALTEPSQVALTLRAVGGLTTAEIARAFLVPEATIAQRISRAKQRIRAAGADVPDAPAGRAGVPAGCGVAGAVPDLQRGLHGQLRGRAAPGGAHRGGHPADPAAARRAPGRRRGRRPARADAADRRPPPGPHPCRRRADPAGRAGPRRAGTRRPSPRASN